MTSLNRTSTPPQTEAESRRRSVSSTPSSTTDLNSQQTTAMIWQVFYFLLLSTLGSFFLMSNYASAVVSASLILSVAAILVLTLRSWTAAMLLGIIQFHLLFLDAWMMNDVDQGGVFVWIVVPIGLVLLISRYRTLHDFNHQSPLRLMRNLFHANRTENSMPSDIVSMNVRHVIWQLLRTIVVVSGCVFLASQLMNFVPLNQDPSDFDSIGEFRLKPTAYRMLILGISLFVVWLVAWLVVNETTWRKLSPKQARLYLRSNFLAWIHRDLRMIVRKRIKTRQAQTRAINPHNHDE